MIEGKSSLSQILKPHQHLSLSQHLTAVPASQAHRKVHSKETKLDNLANSVDELAQEVILTLFYRHTFDSSLSFDAAHEHGHL
jgi:hypothetical protein